MSITFFNKFDYFWLGRGGRESFVGGEERGGDALLASCCLLIEWLREGGWLTLRRLARCVGVQRRDECVEEVGFVGFGEDAGSGVDLALEFAHPRGR